MRRFFKICATIALNEQKKFGAGNKKREKKAYLARFLNISMLA